MPKLVSLSTWRWRSSLRKQHTFPLACPYLVICLVLIGDALSSNGTLAEGAEARAAADVRNWDGSGNNLLNPLWGAAQEPMPRVGAASYGGDGTGNAFPASAELPSPRVVSNALMQAPYGSPSNTHAMTNMVWQWGQFLDHDLTLVHSSDLASESAPIVVDAGDPLAPAIPFQRSVYVQAPNQARQQINSITSYIDGSNVYGSDQTRAEALREAGGRLKTSAGELLPFNTFGLPNASLPGQLASNMFLAGDERANEQVGLISLHTLFVREHNRLVDALALHNSSWSDDELYQTARKIVGAELQAITYGEFLPALLGPNDPVLPKAADYQYDASLRADVTNEFATGIYRFGHSMLPSDIPMGEPGGGDASMPLRNAFFTPEFFASDADGSTHHLEQVLMGLTKTPAMEIDAMVTEEVRNFLFGPPGSGGMDLAALNIQRGRDHGLPFYNDLREAYGLTRAASFADVTSNVEFQQVLASLYESPDSIDAWVGALAEDHFGTAAFGKLIHTALVEQFERLRDGDRYFYIDDAELFDNPAIAEVIDLAAIQFSDVIAWNTQLTGLPDNVFAMPIAIPEPSTALLIAFLGARASCPGRSVRRSKKISKR